MPIDFLTPDLSGEANNPMDLENIFIRYVLSADDLHRESDQIAYRLNDSTDALYIAANSVEYGLDAVSSASYFLGAAVNSLLALRLLTIKEVVEIDGRANVQANITVTGTAGLVRQALECASRAHWLTHAPNTKVLSRRGYAALWENHSQAFTYANAIRSPDLEERKSSLEVLLEAGRAKDLAEEGAEKKWINENYGHPKPTIFLLPATDILRSIRFPEGLVRGLDEYLGQNVNSGEWVYCWLSAMAHGHIWCHTFPRSGDPTRVTDVVRTRPDWVRLTLSTALAIYLIKIVMKSLNDGTPFQTM